MKAARIHPKIKNYPVLYVSGVKKRLNGKSQDWEYSSKAQDAIELTDRWLTIFKNDMKFVGMNVHCF